MNLDLDQICETTTRPAVLNALHACRPGHPLGRGNTLKMNLENALYVAYGHIPTWAVKQLEDAITQSSQES